MKQLVLMLIASVFLINGIGCSHQNDPIQSGQMEAKDLKESVPLESESISKFHPNLLLNRNVMGAWRVVLDTNSMSAEIVPARNAEAIGDIYDADLSQFLLVSPCQNCLRVTGLSIDAYGDILMRIGIKHPFGDITRRPDLHGFDVRAIFIISHEATSDYPDIEIINPDGSSEATLFDNTGNHVGISAPGGLLNADGYTSHHDWLTADERYFINGNDMHGNMNPFLRFFDDFGTGTFDPHAPAGHNVMPVGSNVYERVAVLSQSFLEHPIVEFYIVADVAYGHSAVLANRPDPQYYLPSFNRTEAWRVEYWVENNNLTSADPTSTADLVVQVFDWQHGHEVDSDYPDSDNLSGLRESSDVLQVELSILDFQSNPVIATSPESGNGSPQEPLQYRLTITNEASFPVSSMGLLAIRDELHGSEAPSGRLPVPEAPAGFPFDTLDIRDYSLYMPVIVNVPGTGISGTQGRIDSELYFDYENLFIRKNPGTTIISPSFFMDPSHRQFKYSWDYDYDGVTFNEDGTELPSPVIEPPDPGFYNVGLKVETNSVPPQEYIYELPLYKEGEVFENTVPTSTNQKDITTHRGNHSAAKAANGNYYLVFTNETAGDRNVQLAIIDTDGNAQVSSVTDSSNTSFEPTVYVIDEGANQGVYVAYSERTDVNNYFVYVVRGNLDGSEFLSATPQRISTVGSAMERWPVITYFQGKLLVYYANVIGLGYPSIYASHSDDYGDTWTNVSWVVDNASIYQQHHSIAQIDTFHSNRLWMVWSDGIEFDTNGFDLYLAKSSDGLNFDYIDNISSETGQVHETYPSMDIFMPASVERIFIVYMTYPEGSTGDNLIRVKELRGLYNNRWQNIYELSVTTHAQPDIWHGIPSIGYGAENNFTIAYSRKNIVTNDMGFIISRYYRSSASGWSSSSSSFNMGAVDSDIDYVFPVVVSSSPQPYVVEDFVAWTDYSSGSNETGSPTQFLGDIKTWYHITRGYE